MCLEYVHIYILKRPVCVYSWIFFGLKMQIVQQFSFRWWGYGFKFISYYISVLFSLRKLYLIVRIKVNCLFLKTYSDILRVKTFAWQIYINYNVLFTVFIIQKRKANNYKFHIS